MTELIVISKFSSLKSETQHITMELDDDVKRTNTGPDTIEGLVRLSYNKFKPSANPTDATGSTLANSKIEEHTSNDAFVR